MTRPGRMVIACALSALAGAGAMRAQQQVATRREPQFENEQLRVWKSIILPNQPLTLHRHEHGRALIALVGGKLSVVDQDGKPIEVIVVS